LKRSRRKGGARPKKGQSSSIQAQREGKTWRGRIRRMEDEDDMWRRATTTPDARRRALRQHEFAQERHQGSNWRRFGGTQMRLGAERHGLPTNKKKAGAPPALRNSGTERQPRLWQGGKEDKGRSRETRGREGSGVGVKVQGKE